MPSESNASAVLVQQLLDCMPTGEYGLTAFLRLADIVASRAVSTAAVENRLSPRLLINPDFVQRHAATPEKLFILVMHELHHVLLGHTRSFPIVTSTDNLVFDAVINAMLCERFPEPQFTSMFTDFYRDTQFPECLLRPPSHRSRGGTPTLPPALEGRGEAAKRAYLALYGSPTGATYSELHALLRHALPPETITLTPLLGSHGHASAPSLDELRADVTAIAGAWPAVRREGFKDLLTRASVPLRALKENRIRLAALLRRIAGIDGQIQARRIGSFPSLSPVARYERRAFVQECMGFRPLLFVHEQAAKVKQCRGVPVHIYLDVSGSMDGLLESLIPAVTDCQRLVHPVVHTFSTVVHDTRLQNLASGTVWSTGGTSFGCVAHHIHGHHVKKAVIITDGFDIFSATERRLLQHVKLGAAVVAGGWARPFDGLAQQVVELVSWTRDGCSAA